MAVAFRIHMYTAMSIYVVGSKLQSHATRPNSGLGIHWNLHIGEDENYKSGEEGRGGGERNFFC